MSLGAAHAALGCGVLAAEATVVYTTYSLWFSGTQGYTNALTAGLTASTCLVLAYFAALTRDPRKARAGWASLSLLAISLGILRARLFGLHTGTGLLGGFAPAILLIPPLALLSEPRFTRAASLLRDARRGLESAAAKAGPLRRQAIIASSQASAEDELRRKLRQEEEQREQAEDTKTRAYELRGREAANRVLELEAHLIGTRQEIVGQTMLGFQSDIAILARQLAEWKVPS